MLKHTTETKTTEHCDGCGGNFALDCGGAASKRLHIDGAVYCCARCYDDVVDMRPANNPADLEPSHPQIPRGKT